MSAFSVRQSTSLTSFMVSALDFVAVCLAGWVSYQLRFMTSTSGLVELHPAERVLVLVTSLFAAVFFGKFYRLWPGGSLAAMVARVTVGWLVTWTLLLVILALAKSAETFSRIWLLAWLVVGIASLWLGRIASFFAMAQLRKAGYQHKSVLLYGESRMLHAVRQRIEQATWSGYDIVGTVSPGDDTDLAALDARLKPDEIWVSLAMADTGNLDRVMLSLHRSVANIRLLPDTMMYKILNHGMSITVGIPMVDISVSPMYGSRLLAKRALDILVALFALVLLAPVMLAIAIGVKLTSPGPVLFKQKRHGWNDEEIFVYKFRSMTVHEEEDGAVTQAKKNDSRVTPFGSFLRRSSLDELPQFINVLQGRMSVVGPRPHALKHNDEYVKLIPKYALRHKVKPGITGWAQICGYRGETDTLDKMEARIKHDLHYLEHWSIWMDLKIIFLTPLATIQNKNVY